MFTEVMTQKWYETGYQPPQRPDWASRVYGTGQPVARRVAGAAALAAIAVFGLAAVSFVSLLLIYKLFRFMLHVATAGIL